MTNAERQKRYRDRKRGGPPVGRWPAGLTCGQIAEKLGVGRTSIFMASWIAKNAPDLYPGLQDGTVKVTPTYKRLRAEYLACVVRAVEAADTPAGAVLVISRRDGQFVFEWVA